MGERKTIKELGVAKTNLDRVNLFLELTGRITKIDVWFNSLEFGKDAKNDELSAKYRSEGNQYYKKAKLENGGFPEARRLYTKAVMYGTSPGNEIALAYGNRAAISFGQVETLRKAYPEWGCKLKVHPSGFPGSIIDCDRALRFGYPVGLKHKMYARMANAYMEFCEYKKSLDLFRSAAKYCKEKGTINNMDKKKFLEDMAKMCAKCEKMIAAGKQPEPEINLGSKTPMRMVPHPKCHMVSHQLGIPKEKPGKKMVFRGHNVKRNDCLVTENKPYCFVVTRPTLLITCSFCFKETMAGLPCLSCNMVVYCDDYCRSSDWELKHQRECGVIGLLYDNFNEVDIMAYKILARTDWLGMREVALYDHRGMEMEEHRKYLNAIYLAVFRGDTNQGRFSTEQMLHMLEIAFKMLLLFENRRNLRAGSFLKPAGDILRLSQISNGLPYARKTELLLRASLILRHLQQCWSGNMVKMPMPDNVECKHPACALDGYFKRCRHNRPSKFVAYGCFALLQHVKYGCNYNICTTFDYGGASYFASRDLNAGEQLISGYDIEFLPNKENNRKLFRRGELWWYCGCPVCKAKMDPTQFINKWLCDLCEVVISKRQGVYLCDLCSGSGSVEKAELDVAFAQFDKATLSVCSGKYTTAILELCDFIDLRRQSSPCTESPLIVKAWLYLAHTFTESGYDEVGRTTVQALLEYLERPTCSVVLRTYTGYAVRVLVWAWMKSLPAKGEKYEREDVSKIQSEVRQLQLKYSDVLYPEAGFIGRHPEAQDPHSNLWDARSRDYQELFNNLSKFDNIW